MKLIERLKLKHLAYKYENIYDKGGIAYIKSSIKKGQTVLDIGAHKAGYLSFMLAQVGREGKIYAFEPQSNLFQYISKLKGMFGWNNVTLEHLAISDSKGFVTLFIPTNKDAKASSPGATIVDQKEPSNFGATETVSTQTLDTYCEQHNIKPAFIKIDVEGNELKVFKGGVVTLKKYKPKVIVEIEERHVGQAQVLETFKFMESLGYVGHMLHGLNHIPLSAFSFDKYQNPNDKSNYCNNFIFE